MDATGRRTAGAIAFLVGGLQYVTLEAIAAAAWTDPRYDYVSNYISDLGVPEAQVYQGREVDSPLAWVMNTGFVLEGVLVALGAVLLSVLFAPATRRLVVTFALLHGVGIVLVGLFDETADAGPTHLIGAFLAIVFGNLTALVVGIAALVGFTRRRPGLPLWFAVASIALPVVGFASEGVLLAGPSEVRFDGLWERGGVYSVTLWQLLFGVAVLTSHRDRRTPVAG
jgi:hypothetical membrane protein